MHALAFTTLFFVLCTCATASIDYCIHVNLLAPFHIEFEFDVSKTFEPITLRAYASTNALDLIIFQPYSYETKKTFRNVKPLQFGDDCVLNAELEYIESLDFDPRSLDNGYNPENDIKRVQFDYKVSDKTNKIYIPLANRPGEGDAGISTTTKKPIIEQPHGKLPIDQKPPVDYSNVIDQLLNNADKPKGEEPNIPVDEPHSPAKARDTNNPTNNNDEENVYLYSLDNDESDCDEEQDSYQQKLLETAYSQASFSKRLLLTGDVPSFLKNPVEIVRSIIVNDLRLPELEWEILQAKFLEEGILFEMAAPRDAIKVLTNAELYLKSLRIKSTERDFFDEFSIGGRFADIPMVT